MTIVICRFTLAKNARGWITVEQAELRLFELLRAPVASLPIEAIIPQALRLALLME